MPLIPRRIGFLFAVFLGLLAIAAVRATWLGAVQSERLKNAATTQQAVEVEVPARRGAIVDRRGVELAVTEPAEDIAANPYQVEDPAGAATKLAPLLGQTEGDLLKKLTKPDTGFVYLGRAVPASDSRAVKRLRIPGLSFTPSNRRIYPREWLASQVLGTVGTDGKGLAGVEYAKDDLLRGSPGTRRIVRDALGDAISVRDPVRAQPGARLTLTLDAAIQDKVEETLQSLGAKFRPKGATALVMDPRNGEVLAMANWPRVNANDVDDMPDYAKQNRAIGFNYEPGSTFKAITVAGALEERKVTPETAFNLPPQIQVADRTIGESHGRGYVNLTTAQILSQSSNVGSVIIGQRLGAKRFDHWVRRFGFGEPTGADLPGEEAGQVLPLGKYSGSSMGNLPIGQGISVTPMQMATAYSAIANGGVLRPARIVRSINGTSTRTPEGRRVIQQKTAKALRMMLKGVLDETGTGALAKIPGYQLAGKTGTAEKVDEETGLYSESKYISSFVGFAPADRPRLLVTVMVDEPTGLYYGGEVAAPAFQQITSFALNYLRIPPE